MDLIDSVLEGKYENHVFPFFWQKDNVPDETIVNYINKMKLSNIDSFCVESRPFTGFLQNKWWDRMKLILEEAKKREMTVWILDDYHFPTGYANGAIRENLKLRKKVLKHHIVNVIGPTRSNEYAVHVKQPFPVDNSSHFLAAIAVQGSRCINIGSNIKGDLLYFELPEGRWDINIILISEETDIAPDYINMLDAESCKLMIKEVYEPHYKHFKNEFGKTIVGFFSDEPGFQNEKGNKSDSLIGKDMPLPWSDNLKEKLKEKWGINFLNKLPHLWSDIDETTPRIREQYMDIITNMYQRNFTQQISKWCHEHNVKYIGHVIEDRESHARLGVGPGHYFRALLGQDMAGSDIISNQLMPGLNNGENTWARGVWDGEFFHYLIGKMTSSMAHITPQMNGQSMCEVFGAYGWHEGLPLMKWIIDHQVAQGINNFVPHAFSPAPFPDQDCPPHFYANGENPQFRYFGHLMKYTNQLATLFSNGETRPDVAVLYHGEAEWVGKYMSTQEIAHILTQKHIDFDVIPNDVFFNNENYKVNLNTSLEINKRNYQTLLIPYSEYITSGLYDFIVNNKETRIVFIKDYPKYISDKKINIDLDKLRTNSESIVLPDLPNWLENTELSILNFKKEEPEVTVYRYYKKNIQEYMILNESPCKRVENIILLAQHQKFDRVNLITGERIPLVNGKLELEPLESCILVPRNTNDNGYTKKTFCHEILIHNNPKISFANAEEYPHFNNEQKIKGYPNISYEVKKDFSGTIRYKIEFNLKNEINLAEIVLDRVYEIAEVSLNGLSLGVRFCAPYTFNADNLKKGLNELIIDVTNTLDKTVYEKHSAAVVVRPSGLLSPVKIKY